MKNNITDELTKVLQSSSPEDAGKIIKEHRNSFFCEANPFGTHLKEVAYANGLTLRDVINRAKLPSERFGYRLISGEKHTRNRDTVIQICLGAKADLENTQRLLKLYGMSELYARIARDAVLISALSSEIYEVEEINALLEEAGFKPLPNPNED